MAKQLLVIGAGGQLARALKTLVPKAVFLARDALDLAFPERIDEVLMRHDVSAVINTAAYTQVDKAETEEEQATAVNAKAPAAMADYCRKMKIPFVHFSTDYVFDGSGDKAWQEEDKPSPLNAYGRSKLAGEQAVAEVGEDYLIFRTSWVYDADGQNFVNTVLRLAGEREELRMINDQFGAPTYAPHLAEAALAVLNKATTLPAFPSGIYHLCNSGVTTWHGFAEQIVRLGKEKGYPIKTRLIHSIKAIEYPLPAKRPYNSRLDCSKALQTFGVTLPTWEAGLVACMEAKREDT